MVERVPRQSGVVGFNVHLDLIFQTKLLQETIHRRDIVIVLMLGGLLRFRLDKQRAAKANLMLVLHHHLQEAANLLALLAQVGIQQGLVTFAAAPQNIVFAAELVGAFMAVTTCVAARANTSGSGLVAAPAP